MKPFTLLKNVTVVNEDRSSRTNILARVNVIQKIRTIKTETHWQVTYRTSKHTLPSVIDAHVTFRDPGLTRKGDLHTGTKTTVAREANSFIDISNTIPTVLNKQTQADKYAIVSVTSLINYAFFLSVTKENIDEILKTYTKEHISVSNDGFRFNRKGNLLVDNPEIRGKLFPTCRCRIAIHSEKKQIIEQKEHKHSVQHPLLVMMRFRQQGLVFLKKIVEELYYNSTILYQINKISFIKKCCFANLTIIYLKAYWTVNEENILYKCDWLPLEGKTFQTRLKHTIVNRNLIYKNNYFDERI